MRRILTMFAFACVFAAAPLAAQSPAKKAPTPPRNSQLRLSGNPSSLVSCVQGSAFNTHALGASVRGTRITVELEGNDGFDGMATALVVQMGSPAGDNARVQYAFSDDADGLDPKLEINLENDANVVVMVGSYDGDPGCYFLKVDVRVP